MDKILTPAAPGALPAQHADLLAALKRGFQDYGLMISLVLIMAFFQWATDGVLMQSLNLTNLVLQNSYIVIMALGMLMVIVAGQID